jgi:hypothetical protein
VVSYCGRSARSGGGQCSRVGRISPGGLDMDHGRRPVVGTRRSSRERRWLGTIAELSYFSRPDRYVLLSGGRRCNITAGFFLVTRLLAAGAIRGCQSLVLGRFFFPHVVRGSGGFLPTKQSGFFFDVRWSYYERPPPIPS